jgi:hypothetical protein
MSQNEEPAPKIMQLIDKLLEKTTRPREGKMGIEAGVFRQAVMDDPETAAEFVYLLSKQPEVPSAMGQIAMTIALVYKDELGDDSLVQEISHAPWVSKIAEPGFILPDQQPEPDLLERLAQVEPDIPCLIAVGAEDMRRSAIDLFVENLRVETASPDRAKKMANLWGRCVLTFPLDDDPRHITRIPEARSYITSLHQAMPYFPCYLDFRPGFGMFIVYFGCMAEPDAMSDDGTAINVMHQSVLDKLEESLLAIKAAGALLNKNTRPILRAILSCYPDEVAEDYLNQFV